MTALTLNYRVLATKGADVATRQIVDLIVPTEPAAQRVKAICESKGYSAVIMAVAAEPAPPGTPNRMAGIGSPVAVVEPSPSRNANAV